MQHYNYLYLHKIQTKQTTYSNDVINQLTIVLPILKVDFLQLFLKLLNAFFFL